MKLSTLYTTVPDYIEAADVPANPSSTAQVVPANALTVLDINTLVQDTANIAALASNRIEIPAGTYYFEAFADCGRTGAAVNPQAIFGLWNYTESEWITRAESFIYYQPAHQSNHCNLSGQFTTTTTNELELKILVRTEVHMRPNGSLSYHSDTTSGAAQRQTLKLWKLA